MKFLITIFIFLNSSFLGAEGLVELTPGQMELLQKVGNNLRCPTCIGLSVMQSEAEFAVQIRTSAKEQVLAGKTHDEIMFYFTQRYGLWILREPPKTGFHILAWAIPGAFAILGPILIWFFVGRKRREVVVAKGVRSSAKIIAEMEHELEILRKSSKASV